MASVPGRPARVLVLRSCRPAEFAAAVRFVRGRSPAAVIVALSHCGHRESLRAAGVDDIHELPGRRFGVLRLAPWRLVRLRAAGYDEVVVPQMTADSDVYGNLHRLAFAIGAPRITLLPGSEPAREFGRRAFSRAYLALRSAPRRGQLALRLDKPWFFVLLALAACRTSPPPRRQGRRKVLHIIPSLGLGGAQRQMTEVIRSTPADQYEVEVLVFTTDGGEFSRQWLPPHVRVTLLSQYMRLGPAIREIAARCRAGRYDLVHTWLCLANAVGGAGARLGGVPRVVTSVRSLSLWKRTWYRQWWYRPADALSARIADAVTVNAEALIHDYAWWTKMPRRRIDVVHNGLDPSRFLVDRAESRQRVLAAAGCCEPAYLIGTTGRLAVEKDHRLFLRAIADARRVRPQVHGIVIGDGPLRTELAAYARDLGVADSVSFLGERSDAVRLMAGLDLFMLPSIIEGFPNALLEAVFLGIPALATNVGGCPEVLGDPAGLFAVGDDAAATRAVHAALDDPAAAAARAAAARARALELFTADRTAAAWLSLYSRCLTEA